MEKIFRKIRTLYRKYNLLKFGIFLRKAYSYYYLRYYGVITKFGYVNLYGNPIIRKHKNSKIIIHEGATIISKSKYNLAGINHPTIIATLAKGAIIEIGKVGISGASICCVKSITIGDYSGLGVNSNIYDTDFHHLDPILRRQQSSIEEANSKRVIIGEDVWIASNVTILKGVKIGNGAVIGAGSVVVKDIPERAVYAGNPIFKIKTIVSKNDKNLSNM